MGADPAAEEFHYPVAFDIRNLISLEDVAEELQLGPNGCDAVMPFLPANFFQIAFCSSTFNRWHTSSVYHSSTFNSWHNSSFHLLASVNLAGQKTYLFRDSSDVYRSVIFGRPCRLQ